jgi:hypothetical protein
MPSDDATTEQSPPSETGTSSEPDVEGTGTVEPAGDPVDARSDDGAGETDDGESRDVVVPLRVYKAVTVFTTLFAVATVVGGFVLLDVATDTGQAPVDEINVVVALAGIGLVVVGAAAYAFSTRFRTEGMGKSKDDTDEESDNG